MFSIKKATFIMMVGLPASGKTIFAESLAKEYNAELVSSDLVRIELFGKDYKYNRKDNNHVFFVLDNRIRNLLLSGKNVVYDATNIKLATRMKFLNKISDIHCKKICCYVYKPIDKCFSDNGMKCDGYVKEKDILSMYQNFEIPYYYEGWDNIRIIWSDTDKPDSIRSVFEDGDRPLNEINIYDQDLGHSYNLGKTMVKAHDISCNIGCSRHLSVAVLFAEIAYRHDKSYYPLTKHSIEQPLLDIDQFGIDRMSAQDSLEYSRITHGSGFLRFISDRTNMQKFCLDVAVLIQWRNFKSMNINDRISLSKIFLQPIENTNKRIFHLIEEIDILKNIYDEAKEI